MFELMDAIQDEAERKMLEGDWEAANRLLDIVDGELDLFEDFSPRRPYE